MAAELDQPYKRNKRAKFISTGLVLSAVGMAVLNLPLVHHHSLGTWHSLCTSGLGEMATFFSSSAQADCTNVKVWFYLSWGVIVVGAAFLVRGLLVVGQPPKAGESSSPPSPASF